MISRTMLNNKNHFWFFSFSFAPNPSYLSVVVIQLPKYIQNRNTFHHLFLLLQALSPGYSQHLLTGALPPLWSPVFPPPQNSWSHISIPMRTKLKHLTTAHEILQELAPAPLLDFTAFTYCTVAFLLFLKHAQHILPFTFAFILSVCFLWLVPVLPHMPPPEGGLLEPSELTQADTPSSSSFLSCRLHMVLFLM